MIPILFRIGRPQHRAIFGVKDKRLVGGAAARHAGWVSDPDVEQKVSQLSAKFDSLFIGLKAFLFLFLLFASAGNLVATFSIERYRHLFADALPGMPLPYLTLLVIRTKSLLMILDYIWPTIGLVAVFIRKRIAISLLLFCAALLCAVLQTVMVILAVQLPMIGIINGLSDHP